MLAKRYPAETAGSQGQARDQQVTAAEELRTGSEAFVGESSFVIPRPSRRWDTVTASGNAWPTTTETDESVAPKSVLTLPLVRSPEQRFVLLQQWEGTVSAVSDGEFVAITRDLTDPSYQEERVIFPLEEVSDPDHSLVAAGSVFYWTIGYELTASGTRKTVSMLRFRRLPAWTHREISEAQRQADRWIGLF